MDTEELRHSLPEAIERRGRTYMFTATLGVAFFTLSGIFWEKKPFVGSLFLELGGGAFIAFLLEFVLPAVLGATDNAVRLVFKTQIVWTSSAIGDLLTKVNKADLDDALKTMQSDSRPFPSRVSRKKGITKLKGSHHLAWMIPDSEIVLVYQLRRRGLRREATIVNINRKTDVVN